MLIGDASIMKLLLDSCAELHANDRGDTPEELAMMMGHKQLLPATGSRSFLWHLVKIVKIRSKLDETWSFRSGLGWI